jgi:dTDP-4-amino-4,6-dideoxyglucose formyltransferase
LNKVSLRFSGKPKGRSDLSEIGGTFIDFQSGLELENLISESQLIVSAHCKKIFPTKLVDSVRCINIHPGFNPVNKGWFPQVFSILNNQSAGATIHIMTSDVDAGPVIAQEKVSIEFHENSFDVYQKIIAKEKELFHDNLGNILDLNYNGAEIEGGKYNSLGDFKTLCALDLKSENSLEYHLRLLKSLTFPGFQNAHVWVGGEKYFIEVKITPANQDSKN